MDYPELYRELYKEIVKVDGDIGNDTQAFLQRFIAALPEDKSKISDKAKAELTAYLTAMNETVRNVIVIATALGLTGRRDMQNKKVLALAEQAFVERWADDLTLSNRLWNWNTLTEEGMGQMLQEGVKTGQLVNKLMYNMQYMLEFDQAKQFAMISNNRNKWTAELTSAAKQLIHNPQATQQWQYTLKRVEAYIDKLATTGTRHASLQLLNQIKRAVVKNNLALVDSSLQWWLYDKQLYNLKRIARTEMATAAHRAIIEATIGDELIIGYQWRLSSGHKIFDICDYYANIDQGLGKGVWRKDSVPRHKAHPHCMCTLIPRATKIKESGTENYAEFLGKITDKQRAQILPKWAATVEENGISFKSLVRDDGLGLISMDDFKHRVGENKFNALMAK